MTDQSFGFGSLVELIKEQVTLSDSQTDRIVGAFLSGGGEMGALIREKDWSSTAVGPISSWSQDLHSSLNIVIHSGFPMLLLWGEELMCFYNDAFRPSLGTEGEHPAILGARAEDAFKEAWSILSELMDHVMSGKGAVWREDQLIPMLRNGRLEDVYWTFSYSPVIDESEDILAVLVTCIETTEKVNSLKVLQDSESRYRHLIEDSMMAKAVFSGPNMRMDLANKIALDIWGLDSSVFGQELLAFVPELKEQPIWTLMQQVLHTEKSAHQHEQITYIHSEAGVKTYYFNFHYTPIVDPVTQEPGVMVSAIDVTEQVAARLQLEKLNTDLRLFKSIADNLEDYVGMCDLEFKPFYLNEQARRMRGRSTSGKLGDIDYFEHFHPDDLQSMKEEFFPEVIKESMGQIELQIMDRATGKYVWGIYNVLVIEDSESRPFGYATIFNNIDIRKKSELAMQAAYEQVEQSENIFRLLADSMPQFVWSSGPRGNINYFNSAVHEYSGLSEEELTDGGWIQIVHPEERKENIKAWEHSIENQNDFIFEHRFRRSDGKYRWQLSRAVPLKDAGDNVVMWIGTSTDIHNLKIEEEQKNHFIAMASHELKTPVTSLKGYVQILQNFYGQGEDAFLIESLNTMERQVNTLTDLIRNLLDLSKMTKGGFELEKSEFSVKELIEDVIKEVAHVNPRHVMDFKCDDDVVAYGDQGRLAQVVVNFLTNAIKYGPDSYQIEVNCSRDGDAIKVSVKDYGIGINRSDKKKVFERFFRVEGINEKTFPGFGIGLFISAEIIRKHGGKIGLESKPGKGSEFFFILPVTHPES